MEEDLTTADDPAESYDNNIDAEEEKVLAKDYTVQMAYQSPGLPCSDQCDPDETSVEESGSHKTDRKVSKKSTCKIQQGAVFSGKILSFGCSECKGDATYSPNDLLKHFQGIHKGTLPTYPCDLCGFVTNEFPALQRHRIGHRNTLVTCEICNDDVQYTLLLLTRHYIISHSQNGHFHCEKCEFSTVDAGTFVQHIHHHNENRLKCVKCQHLSSSQGEHQKHLKLHSGTFPFTCQVCGYGAARREYLTKHMGTVHTVEADKIHFWRETEDSNNTLANSSPGLKLLLKKSPAAVGQSKESQWMSKLSSLPGVLDQNGRLLKPEKTLEETQQFLERPIVVQKESKKLSKVTDCPNDQPFDSQAISSILPKSQEIDDCNGADALNTNGLTVLMVKNKISIPPNCTTKVMGFKMVDGKKHLVLKIIPTTKPEFSIENEMLCTEQDLGCPMVDHTVGGSKCSDSAENREKSNICSPYFAVLSPSGPDREAAGSVEVKFEEEDIRIEEALPIVQELAQKANITEQQKSCEPHNCKDKQISPVSRMITKSVCSPIEKSNLKKDALLNSIQSNKSDLGDNVTDTLHPNLNAVQVLSVKMLTEKNTSSKLVSETMLSKPDSNKSITTFRFGDQSPATDFMMTNISPLSHGDASLSNDKPKETFLEALINTPPSDDAFKKTHSFIDKSDPFDSTETYINSCVAAKTSTFSPERIPQLESHLSNISKVMDTNTSLHISSNQEVFNFHNYSKETSSISYNSNQPCEHPSELSTEDESFWMKESPEWSLTLAESPEPLNEESEYLHAEMAEETAMERVSDSDIEVDECIATVEDLSTPVATEETHGHSGSTQQVQPTVTMEESVLLSEKSTVSVSNSAVLGRILEEHSDAIINHQLEKDRIGCSTAIRDSVKPPKTMLRILKTTEGKQQMFLQAGENQYAVPVQLQGNPGFKLITKYTAPQINVSYVKPGIEVKNNTTGLALTLNDGRLSVPGQTVGASEKGATLLSAVQHASGTSHYIVNSTSLKGPLFFSGAPHGSFGEKNLKSQQTCFLVQRPVPVAQAPNNAGSKLASSSSQSPLTSCPAPAISANSVNKSSALHTGRQAFLVRYISPVKSGMILNNPDMRAVNHEGESNESKGNKVVYKIVRTANGSTFLASGAPSTNNPIFLAANSTQTPFFLMTSNNVSTGLKKLIPIQNASHKPAKSTVMFSLQSNGQGRVGQQASMEVLKKSPLSPRPSRQLSQRKRRRKALFDELPEHLPKTRRLSSKVVAEKGATSVWEPVPKNAERIMRLYPFSSLQEIKCPRRNQPVVVLNHPDADIPEVAILMKSVNKYKGAVSKVALSPKTVEALSEHDPVRLLGNPSKVNCPSSQRIGLRLLPLESRVRERFLLKLKFRKTSRRKYKVVKSLSRGAESSSMFACWFCGRLFNNQEVWIGHGQRHLMEATRDWNKLC